MKILSRVTLIVILLALLSQSMLLTTIDTQSTSATATASKDVISGNPLWYGIGSDWRIYQSTPQNPGGTPLNLTELMQGWQNDITNYQEKYAFNAIRLAFSFADSGQNLTHSVLNITELDDVLQLFASYNIKVILDLHNWDDPAHNVTDMPGFFGSSKWIADWKDVASQYKDDTEILAYEIFNEPSCAFGTWDPSVTGGGCGIPYNGTGKSVTMALAECVDAIRSIGDNHPIIYPDPHYFTVANDENDPERFFQSSDNRQNIVITFHDWFPDESESVFQASWNNSINLQKSWESYYPIWIGEFGMFDNSSFQTEVDSEIIKWAVDNLVGFSIFIARSNPTAREEQWTMSESALTDFTSPAPERAQSVVFNTVYIRDDGTVDPPTAPIQRNGNVYNLTSDMQFNDSNGGLVVEKDNVIVNGGGHALELYSNPDDGVGIVLSQRNNVTITEVSSQTVLLDSSSNCSILDSSILLGLTNGWSVILSSSNNNSILRNVMDTIALDNSSNNYVALNTMTGGGQSGYGVTFSLAASYGNIIFRNIINYAENLYPSPSPLLNFSSSSDNIIYHNFLSFPYWWYKTYSPGSPVVVVQADNSSNTWDDGYPSGGNYWASYNFTDRYSGPYQNESGSDGISDTPYLLAPSNIDNYPLMNPVTIPFEDISITEVQPRQTLIPAGNLASFDVSVNNHGGYAASWDATLNIEYAYVQAERDFTLQADAVQGWNQTMPGPTITVIQGDTVTLSMKVADNLNHQFYVDYNNNSLPDNEEPMSPSFNTSTTFSFTASVVGNFTYYDADHQNTMFGLFSVQPLPTQSSQAGPNSIYLESNQNATLTFAWNTTGFMYGEYIISAYAKPALRETDITDNILSGGLVNVTIPGDLNGDYQVTPLDITIITSAFGSQLGQAKWNSNADLNNDGIVNMKDIGILARHYGQPYPWPLGPSPPPTSPPSGP